MSKHHPLDSQSPPFGLVAWLEETRVRLPLKAVEARFEIAGDLAAVELDQIFHHDTTQPLDCEYTFPLPAGAAVYRCEIEINGRIIRACVRPRAEARTIFLEQKAAGRRAAMVETERENVFTLSLGNVQPGDLVIVQFAWFQTLDRAADGLRLLVPTCPGVRYIPGQPLLRGPRGRGVASDTDSVPDASRITPPRIDELHPDAAWFSIAGTLASADVASGSITSPSHSILVRTDETQQRVELSSRSVVPDRDFILTWQEPRTRELAPRSWSWTRAGECYALVQFRAPAEVAVAEQHVQDFYFLVDRSGSMDGEKWTACARALTAFVKLLGPQDRVWITLFEETWQDYAEEPLPPAEVLRDRSFQRLGRLGVGGGTEMLPAARHVLAEMAAHSAQRRTNVIVITDGQVGNEAEILAAFAAAPHVRVHTFGIDLAVNDAFLKALAAQQRGGCWLRTPNDDIVGTIAGLGSRLRRPVLSDLEVTGSWRPAGARIPDLHAEETVQMLFRGRAATSVTMSARTPAGAVENFTIPLTPCANEAIRLAWARTRIATLLAAGQSAEAQQLAVAHNLLCEGMAFIAWDEAEQVPVAARLVVQPSMILARQPVRLRTVGKLSSHPLKCLPSAPIGGLFRSTSGGMDNDTSFGDFIDDAEYEPHPVAQPALTDVLRAFGIEDSIAAAIQAQFEKESAFVEVTRPVELLLVELSVLRTGEDGERLVAALGRLLSHLRSLEPAAAVRWLAGILEPFEELRPTQIALEGADVPEELIERLLVAAIGPDQIRVGFLQTLQQIAARPIPLRGPGRRRWQEWRECFERELQHDAEVLEMAIHWTEAGVARLGR